MTVHPFKRKLITILAHILVWLVFAIAMFFYHPIFSGLDIPYQAWVKQIGTLVLLVIAFYVNVAVLVPRLLLNNQFLYYFTIIVILVAATGFINKWMDNTLDTRQAFVQNREQQKAPVIKIPGSISSQQRSHLDRATIIICALVLGIGTSITVIRKWQKDQQEREALEKDKVTSELSYLKAQINPHFFFNTLNNIYALTQVDADEAGKAIHRLSRMMRYLLYETQAGQTMLSQEIAFMNDYICLMQLRLTNAVTLLIDTPVQLLDMPMAPMILLPFVENAFKHGVSATHPSHIGILIRQKGSELDIIVKNSIMKDNNISLDTSIGIGLLNTRRRLELLYPDKYKLEISEMNTNNEYAVHLILNLS